MRIQLCLQVASPQALWASARLASAGSSFRRRAGGRRRAAERAPSTGHRPLCARRLGRGCDGRLPCAAAQVFSYHTQFHDVWVQREAGCEFAAGSLLAGRPNVSPLRLEVPANWTGEYAVASSVGEQCAQGMRLRLHVDAPGAPRQHGLKPPFPAPLERAGAAWHVPPRAVLAYGHMTICYWERRGAAPAPCGVRLRYHVRSAGQQCTHHGALATRWSCLQARARTCARWTPARPPRAP